MVVVSTSFGLMGSYQTKRCLFGGGKGDIWFLRAFHLLLHGFKRGGRVSSGREMVSEQEENGV